MSLAVEIGGVAAAAALTGVAEVVSRYRSDPGYALAHSVAAWAYIVLNGSAGVAALLLIHATGWTFGQSTHVELWRVLVAGFSAIAFFRSSFFVARVGNQTVGIGPSLVLGALLDACDREIDRKSAKKLSETVPGNLDELVAETVLYALPVLCLALMQNYAASDQAQLGAELIAIRSDEKLGPRAKVRAVVMQLSKALGPDVVTSVLTNARAVFTDAPPGSSAGTEAVLAAAREELRTSSPRSPS